ncbi:MAG: four helix bundle protein [Nitrospinae bacterium]|nr:four helix bundle protein [Nitrospinota bacterium]
MDIFRFLDWQVYKDSKALFKLIYGIVSKLPKDVRYELGNQIIRSSFSVILNLIFPVACYRVLYYFGG